MYVLPVQEGAHLSGYFNMYNATLLEAKTDGGG